MTDTARLGIELAEQQAQWPDIPFNDFLRWLDANGNTEVVSATTTAEPGAPTNGQVYILPTGKTGTNWGGFAVGQLAYYSTTWTAFTAKPGTRARVSDTGEELECTAANTWVAAATLFGTKGADIASASTVDLTTATGDYVHITGTATITAFTMGKAGIRREVVFDGALTLTYNATSLILPTAANITTVAGDRAVLRSLGSGNTRVMSYQRADGTALALQVAAMEYKGAWNASTNSPTLADGAGGTGDVYRVSVAGTQNLGSGNITFGVGDNIIYNGTIWEKIDNTQEAITSGDVTTALGYTPDRTFPVVTAMGNQSGSINVDLSLGKYYSITMTGNLTIAFTNGPSSGYAVDIVLMLTQDGTGGRTVTITGALYPNGVAYSATAAASATDHVGVRILGSGAIHGYPVENMA